MNVTKSSTGAISYAVTSGQVGGAFLKRLAIHRVGLIRLVTNPIPLLSDDRGTRVASTAQILKVVDTIRAAGLRVIVDLHTWPPGDPARQSAALVNDVSQRERFSRALLEIAPQLQVRPAGSIGLELLNEPACKFMDGTQWPELQLQIYRALRREAPTLPLILKGCNDGINDLMELDVAQYRNDPNVIFSFHFYEPFIFTHQATYYRGSAFRGVPFPATPQKLAPKMITSLSKYFAMPAKQIMPGSLTELEAYLRDNRSPEWYAQGISQVGVWADSEGIARRRILVGEFGVTLKSSPDTQKILPDVVRWLQMVSHSSQREGFAYALWPPVRPGDAYIDTATNFPRQDVMRALGWRPR
ncbi:glycoside hydrolase family 5 protein [Sphingomonas sp. Leaf230]|uniref:glycoside hydrolase family 5 protein n=1 Tax=Sphingomonas sp. Leaf230 TaxID=1735694 RepID=UPI00138F6ACB|nr:cellulase family glycosylhydrolase [Sphingomonas sp. Leaf230]